MIPQRDPANTEGYGGVHISRTRSDRVISSRLTYKRDLCISRKHFDFSKGFDTQQISTPVYSLRKRRRGKEGEGEKDGEGEVKLRHFALPSFRPVLFDPDIRQFPRTNYAESNCAREAALRERGLKFLHIIVSKKKREKEKKKKKRKKERKKEKGIRG